MTPEDIHPRRELRRDLLTIALVLLVVATLVIASTFIGCDLARPAGEPVPPRTPPSVDVRHFSGTLDLEVLVCSGDKCAPQRVATRHVAYHQVTGEVRDAEAVTVSDDWLYCHVGDLVIDADPAAPAYLELPRIELHISHGATSETHAACFAAFGEPRIDLVPRTHALEPAGERD